MNENDSGMSFGQVSTAFLLAAGYGTRLLPLTLLYPKTCVTLGQVPLIAYHLDSLLAAGVQHFFINLHHQAYRLQSFIEFVWGLLAPREGCKLTFLHEPQILGTGGGLEGLRENLQEDWFFLVNTDMIHQIPLRALADQHVPTEVLAALILRKPELDRHKQVSMGPDGFLGQLGSLRIQEKIYPVEYGFTGIHICHRRLLDYVKPHSFQCIIRDVYREAIHQGEQIRGQTTEAYWREIGDWDQLLQVQRDILEKKVSFGFSQEWLRRLRPERLDT